MLNIFYKNKNLLGVLNELLNGFINSLMIIGGLIFSIGLVDRIIGNKFNYLELGIIFGSILGFIFKDITKFIVLGIMVGTIIQYVYKK
ncbi:Uncharacterised protein [[Clostridium] sordellii]|uniref:Uncharacterized protein n=1 Tax=Paraclostridium sordellii TaxID=1505 RepID=A0ABM9RLV7_PARSO|nr:hypothetical protein [Paeniclostridium sordellii]CEJ72919.1 hypothetical protein ATCC9714_08071 [[Clostridium] sordellii] [Paeniclostridium sordellii]CEN68472.1 Uncharacterised protein [[Clostridium] sordellii] [Paeniclostridium sordellii]CEN71739.1 Uncharacterised protein [[Clostridium] sordellii] [Paeniclostridium sordellii]CEO22246.1 Uncharacterised protein [[Clostridium] sordellii] [Paeniclostridium sordellii]CEP76668.1 Uncharacterised protein [[Clostridium] sordellii] [Paeniclostridium